MGLLCVREELRVAVMYKQQFYSMGSVVSMCLLHGSHWLKIAVSRCDVFDTYVR